MATASPAATRLPTPTAVARGAPAGEAVVPDGNVVEVVTADPPAEETTTTLVVAGEPLAEMAA